jgi:hypothetical protein
VSEDNVIDLRAEFEARRAQVEIARELREELRWKATLPRDFVRSEEREG